MRRLSTTVVAIVGEGAEGAVAALADAANVRVLGADDTPEGLDRAVSVWSCVASVHAPFAVHAADPLLVVGDAWSRLFSGEGPRGELELAVADTLARWRAGSIDLPDFYVVLDADELEQTRRHWYLGLLHGAAPSRVVPAKSTHEDVCRAIGGFSAGRWWPALDEMLTGIEHIVPDRAGLAQDEAATKRVSESYNLK